MSYFFFFFQAEDGIRDRNVTGVQTCALPISSPRPGDLANRADRTSLPARGGARSQHDRSLYRPAPAQARTRRHQDRSEERRVGKECRTRWSAYHEKKKE